MTSAALALARPAHARRPAGARLTVRRAALEVVGCLAVLLFGVALTVLGLAAHQGAGPRADVLLTAPAAAPHLPPAPHAREAAA